MGDSIKNIETFILFFIMFYQKCDFLGHLRSTLQSTEGQFLSVFTFIYFCPLLLKNYSLMFTCWIMLTFQSLFHSITFSFVRLMTNVLFFLLAYENCTNSSKLVFLEYQNVFTISG